MGRKKEQEHKTLARWIIDKTNTDHYRAGMLSGWKHPYIDADVMEIVGGRKQLLDQANILENETNAGKMGKFKPNWKDVKTSIKKIDYDVAIIPELCEREQIEDPRERQLRLIARVEKWRRKGQDCAWLCSYYDDLLDLLNRGKEQKELEDVHAKESIKTGKSEQIHLEYAGLEQKYTFITEKTVNYIIKVLVTFTVRQQYCRSFILWTA